MLRTFVPHHLIDKLPLLVALVFSSALSIALLAFRILYSDQITFIFLTWNLFLAWVPLFCALAAWQVQGKAPRPNLLVLPLLALWLLFLPNAPYIATDLMHLAPRYPLPIWFDMLMLFSYGWNGIAIAVTSLWIVHSLVERWYGRVIGWLCAGTALVASSFGIFLGRFLRWNSWDILRDPVILAKDIYDRLVNPFAYPHTLSVTIVFSCFLLAVYLTMTAMAQVKWENERR